jgi:hypothetical protein
MRLQWIETAGGPHLVLPERYAAAWEGCSAPSGGRVVEATFRCDPGGSATDYDRACSVEGWIGVIPVGRGQALALTGDDTQTAYYRTARGQHFLLRWIYAESETELLDYFDDVRCRSTAEHELEWRHPGGKVLLMDSGDRPGHWLVKPSEFRLPRGRYRVLTFYSAGESNGLIFHELRRTA